MLNSLLNNKIPVYKWWTNERIFQQNPSLCLHKDGLCYPLILFIVMLQVVKEFCHIDLFPAKFQTHLVYWYQVIQHLLTKINYYSPKLFCRLM